MVSQIHFVPAGRLINYTYWHFQHKEVHLSIHSFSAVDYLRTSGERTFISWSTHFFSPWLFDPHPASEHPLILISQWGGYLIQDSPHFRCTSLSRTISLFGHEHDYVRSVEGSLRWTTPRHSLFQFCLVQVFDFGTADNHLDKSNQSNQINMNSTRLTFLLCHSWLDNCLSFSY